MHHFVFVIISFFLITALCIIMINNTNSNNDNISASDFGTDLSDISNAVTHHVSNIHSSINHDIFAENATSFMLYAITIIIIVSTIIAITLYIKNKSKQAFINEVFRLSGIQELYPEKNQHHANTLKAYLVDNSISKSNIFNNYDNREIIMDLIYNIKKDYDLN